MMTNTPATLYNARREGGANVWQRTVLDGVFWEDGKQYSFRKTGMAGSDTATVFIPHSVGAGGKEYVKPKAYKAAGEVGNAFTLAPKDFLVKGICPYEYGPDAPISDLTGQYDDVLVIAGVDTNDFGSPDMRHWEVSGE